MVGTRSAVGPDDEADEFTRRLRELEAGGSAVLVVGKGSGEVHDRMCQRLLGDGTAGDRHRVLASTNGTFDVDRRLSPGGVDPGDTHLIRASRTRSTSAVAPADTGVDVTDLGDASLSELGVALVEAVEGIERRHGPLDATDLRVGVDSLSPLLDAHGEQAVFRFLVFATAYVRRFDALGHVHLPVDRDSYVVELLAPLFDAVVEVRVRDGRPQQRWHLDDAVSSRWLSL